MNIIKKIENIFTFHKKEVSGAQVWLVSWYKFKEGSCIKFPNPEQVAKAFLSIEDAVAFAKNLSKAQEILQNTNNIHIKINKQE